MRVFNVHGCDNKNIQTMLIYWLLKPILDKPVYLYFFQKLHPNSFNVAAFSSDSNYHGRHRTRFPSYPSLNV